MTAGSGVIHSEMPEKEFVQKGGKLHGFQLWVNLPKKDKMIKPRYQDVDSSKIPIAYSNDNNIRVKIIAGESMGQNAVIDTKTPIMYLHFTLEPGSSVTQKVPKDYNSFVYVIGGEGLFGDEKKPAKKEQAVFFKTDGDEIFFSNSSDAKDPLDVLLLGGVPLGEPVARYGPFVMNTQEELDQAAEDYRNGKMVKIDF